MYSRWFNVVTQPVGSTQASFGGPILANYFYPIYYCSSVERWSYMYQHYVGPTLICRSNVGSTSQPNVGPTCWPNVRPMSKKQLTQLDQTKSTPVCQCLPNIVMLSKIYLYILIKCFQCDTLMQISFHIIMKTVHQLLICKEIDYMFILYL